MAVTKKKKTLIVIIIILVLIVGGFMIFRYLFNKINKPSENNHVTDIPEIIKDSEPLAFESFEMKTHGMSAEERIVEVRRTDSGAYLEYSVKYGPYDEELDDYSLKTVIRHIEGDEEFYDTLCKLLGSYKVKSWDGFVGKNPPGVLDGESGSFSAVLSDGQTINAHGSNNFPKNFKDLYNLLIEMAVIETVSDTTVSTDYFSVTVPEEWIGVVKIRYYESMLVFFLEDTRGQELSFLIFNYESYWYGDDKFQHLGILKNTENAESAEFKIIARNNASLPGNYDYLTNKQKVISDTFEQYEQSVIDSFRGINGYELVPEE